MHVHTHKQQVAFFPQLLKLARKPEQLKKKTLSASRADPTVSMKSSVDQHRLKTKLFRQPCRSYAAAPYTVYTVLILQVSHRFYSFIIF